jgi:hypothetical protein
MIPQDKTAAVDRGLLEAFGATAMDDIQRMTKGLSSDLVFRIVVAGSPYLLRVMTRSDEYMDPVRIFACMNAAADAGVTPRVLYSNAADGVSITDFVEAVPLPEREALVRIPRLLRRVHALPPFPKTFNYVTTHKGFIWRFRNAGLVPASQIEEIYPQYEQVCAVYPRLDSDMVSCHSDLKPENILFDGDRLWLVDWQAAFANDRYFDLAVASNFIVTGDADEGTYLENYFGQPPDDYQRARFFLMGQVVHMFYAAVFLLLGSAGKPLPQLDSLPLFREFHRRIWAGEINLADNANKLTYGMVHWEQLLHNLRQPRFAEALGIVAGRNAAKDRICLLLPQAP